MKPFLSSYQGVSFFGRPYQELLRCFGLVEPELRGKTVLECPSGPSSFVAEASRRGIECVGVDPLFYRCPQALGKLAFSDFAEMFAMIREKADRFAQGTYSSIEEAERVRRAGLMTFLDDYASGIAAGRYRQGSLPNLGFADRSFDVALCAHLLFVYSESLDLDFHLQAVAELCRVARQEVRIHPIVDGSNRRCSFLEQVIERAEFAGFSARIIAVDHEFFRGTSETLLLRRSEA